MMVVKLAEGSGLTAAGIEVFEGTDWKEQVAATGQGIVRVLFEGTDWKEQVAATVQGIVRVFLRVLIGRSR